MTTTICWLAIALTLMFFAKKIFDGRQKYSQQKLERQNITLDVFVDEFREERIPRSVLEMVFKEIEALAHLPPRRKDHLIQDLGLDEDEFSDVIVRVSKTYGIEKIEKTEVAPLLPLSTINDFVQFVWKLSTRGKR